MNYTMKDFNFSGLKLKDVILNLRSPDAIAVLVYTSTFPPESCPSDEQIQTHFSMNEERFEKAYLILSRYTALHAPVKEGASA